MPVYEFCCPSNFCPTYEVWRSISERDTNTDCPECGEKGKRLFNPPKILTGSFRLKKERKEPIAIKRIKQCVENKPRFKENQNRPWMLNRGC